MQKINSLTIRLPNWVGDVIMALPAIQALQDCGIALHLLGKPWIQDLLAATKLPLYSLTNNFWPTTKILAGIKNDKVLLLTNSFSSALMAKLAGKAAIGYKSDGRTLLLKKSLAKTSTMHEVEYFWELAHFAQNSWFRDLSWPSQIPQKNHLPLTEASLAVANQILEKNAITKPFIVVCPFAHGKGKDNKSKIWPHWFQLIKELAGKNIVVCPAKNELALCAGLAPEATILSGLHLGEYAAILSKAEKVIANDSGPMHMAAALNTSTIGIFGVTNPMRTHPWGGTYLGQENAWPTLSQVLTVV